MADGKNTYEQMRMEDKTRMRSPARLIFHEIKIGHFARAGKVTAMKMAFNGGVTLIIVIFFIMGH